MQAHLGVLEVKHSLQLIPILLMTLSFKNTYAITFEQAFITGKYLAYSDLLVKIKNSECGYMLKKPPPPVKKVMNEVKSYLKDADSKELDIYFNSIESEAKMKKNDDLINDSLSNWKKNGMDGKTACGMTVGSLASINPKLEWENIKNNLK